MQKGLFITFEGIDGCGKSTQLDLCEKYFINKGYEVLKTLEPGAGKFGKKIREILLHYDEDLSSIAESFLFLADRSQHIEYTIKPAIEKGKIVLCDRHTYSTNAYQGYGIGNDIERIKQLNEIATNGIIPDLTFVFDLPLEIAQKRMGRELDRMENNGNDFNLRVKNGYLELAKLYPNRIKLINANQPVENVFEDVKKYLDEVL